MIIWTKNGESGWSGEDLVNAKGENFSDTCWRASWSLTGNILAVTCGDNTVTLWKQGADKKCAAATNVVRMFRTSVLLIF